MTGSTFAQIKARVSRGLNQERAWSDTDIEAAVNQTYVNLVEYSGCFENEKTLYLESDQTYYDLEIDLALPFDNSGLVDPAPVAGLTPLRVWNPRSAIWLDMTTVGILDRQRPRWGDTGGSPQQFFMRGASVMGIYPKPKEATEDDYLVVRYTAVPSYLTEAAQTTAVPRQFEDAFESGARWYLKGLEREPKAAMAAWQEYVEKREQLKEFVERRMSRAYTPVMGGRPVEARR